MQWRNSPDRYGAMAQGFHWLIAVLLVVQYGIGLYGVRLGTGFEQLVVLARHKSLGITLFGLALLRLAWRGWNPPPPLPGDMRRAERGLAHASHGLLYLLLFTLPVTGWLFSSASGISVSWFGWITLPDLVGVSEPLADALLRVHIGLSLLLVLTVALHVAAALWHHRVRRDTVLLRMLPGRWGRRERQS